MTTVSLENGKYDITIHDDGRVTANRFGDPWQDLTGNKMIYLLAMRAAEAEGLRQSLEVIAVGDSTNPVADAGAALVGLGYWDAERAASVQTSMPPKASDHIELPRCAGMLRHNNEPGWDDTQMRQQFNAGREFEAEYQSARRVTVGSCPEDRCQDQEAHCNGACHGVLPDGSPMPVLAADALTSPGDPDGPGQISAGALPLPVPTGPNFLREAPAYRSLYWSIAEGTVGPRSWESRRQDYKALANGHVFATQSDAIAAYELQPPAVIEARRRVAAEPDRHECAGVNVRDCGRCLSTCRGDSPDLELIRDYDKRITGTCA